MKLPTLALVACLLVAGCSAPMADAGDEPWPADPAEDRLGWEDGYWYNESVAVDQSDGLNASEREAFLARTMARVERIRGLEFEQTVPVEVVSREEFKANRNPDTAVDSPRERWREQVWEAQLLVGEDRAVAQVFAELYGGRVLGYYAPGQDRIVIVTGDDEPTIDRATLAHELVHALQDQHFSSFGGDETRDERLARQGLTEGDANYVEALYQRRCAADGAWHGNCVARPNGSSTEPLADRTLGVYLSVLFPYSEGPQFVDALRERGGWDAVDDAYRAPPTSTEQVIHPERYPEDRPRRVTVRDRSSAAWSRFQVRGATTRLGEASLFTMFWFQRGLNRSTLTEETGNYSFYNYVSTVTEGWAGDRLVPYRSDAGEAGYVWRIEWNSSADARAFRRAYVRMLHERLNATRVREGVFRVPDSSPYGDAFRVTRRGDAVTIVNAPTVDQLDDVHDPPS